MEPAYAAPTPTAQAIPATAIAHAPPQLPLNCQFATASPCTEAGCRSMQKIAGACQHRRCKKHCLERSTPCGFKSHDQERRAMATVPVDALPDPFRLTHPPPVVPPMPHLTQATSTQALAPTQPTRQYRDTMPEQMKREWDVRTQAQVQRNEDEARRRRNLVLVNHTITAHGWAKDGHPPLSIAKQCSDTWPTIDLESLPNVLKDLNLEGETSVERYHPASRTWVSQHISHAMKVRPQEHLFVRRIGVSICLNFDDIFANTLGQHGRLMLFGNPKRAVAAMPLSTAVPANGMMYGGPACLPGYGYPSTTAAYSHPWPHTLAPPTLPVRNSIPSLRSADSAMSIVSSNSAMSLSSDLVHTLDSVQSNLSRMSIHASHSDLEKLEDCLPIDRPMSTLDRPMSSLDHPMSTLDRPMTAGLPGSSQCIVQPGPAQVPFPASLPRLPPPATCGSQPPPANEWSFSMFSATPVEPTPTIIRPTLPILALEDLDQLWQYHVVHTPATKRPWPAGIYARDMARAFHFIDDGFTDESGLPKDLATRFSYVFQGIPFKSATYQSQRSAWVNSTQAQREEVMNKPRTHAGLWTECRKKLDGWKGMRSHKRGHGKYNNDSDME